MRPKGVIVYKTPKPAFKIAPPVETGERQEPEQPQRPKGVLVKGDRPKPPNYICYPMLFGPGMPWDFDPKTCTYRDGKGARRVPKCKKCQGLLHPTENHECEGFIPQYEEWTEEREERWEQRRDEIREMRANGWHDEDDADEPEEDWNDEDDYEGDDDGYDCE